MRSSDMPFWKILVLFLLIPFVVVLVLIGKWIEKWIEKGDEEIIENEIRDRERFLRFEAYVMAKRGLVKRNINWMKEGF
jgi:lipopolysaccharide export LptBFGC system permease protein LptF